MYSNLKDLRKDKNLRAETIAKALGLKTVQAYYKKENGNIKFSLEEARIISKILKKPIEKIFLTTKSQKWNRGLNQWQK